MKDNTSLWEWKGVTKKRRKHGDNKLSVTQILQDSKQKVEEAVMGAGAGAGCGIGLGWGVVGGVGMAGGSSWNQLKLVFGIGFGCGVGVGIGYGQGVGVATTLDSIKKQFFQGNNTPSKPLVIKI